MADISDATPALSQLTLNAVGGTCSGCKFSVPDFEAMKQGATRRRCRWAPPTVCAFPQPNPRGQLAGFLEYSNWPPVPLDGWCGQFSPAIKQ